MRLTDQNLAEQLRITGREIARRKELLRLSPEDTALLVAAKPLLAESLADIVDGFYADQVQKPEIERLIGDAETLARLKNHMTRYLLALFDGVYDDIYVLSRLRVGLVHDRIGVPPKLYISSVRTLQDLLRRRVLACGLDSGKCQHLLEALEKVFFFDLTLVFDTYIHALLSQVERAKAELESYARGLEQEVEQRTLELARLARRDTLTDLPNQRAFFEELRREVAHAQRNGEDLVLAYMDLDGFKAVNDTYGHAEGDSVLRGLADALREVARSSDLPGRIGGDEFVLLLPGANQEKATAVCRRLFQVFDAGKKHPTLTLSVGLAALDPATPQAPEILIRQADQAMYEAKRQPGHQVVLSPPAGQDA